MDKNQELPEVIENEEDTSDFEFLNSPVVPELPPDRQVGISSRPAIYRRRSLMGQTVAGRYVVIDLLGEGVITEVYSAQDNDTGKIVVLKVLIDEAPAAQANFRKSAENCRKLEHENIAGILDICQSEDDKTIVIGEFLRAANLRDLQDTVGVFDEQDIYSVLKDICLALDYAHNSGCIHGGLRPTNVLLTQDQDDVQIKVLDFGTGRFELSNRNATGVPDEVSQYLSPEQVRDNRVEINSDVYALGVIAYRLVTGNHPTWSEETPQEDGKRSSMVLASIGSVRADFGLAERFNELLEDALEQDPNWRLPSITAFRQGLEDWYEKFEDLDIAQIDEDFVEDEDGSLVSSLDGAVDVVAMIEPAVEGLAEAKPVGQAKASIIKETEPVSESGTKPGEGQAAVSKDESSAGLPLESQRPQSASEADSKEYQEQELSRPQPPPPPPRPVKPAAAEDKAEPRGKRRRTAKTMKLKTTVRNLVALRTSQNETENTLAMQFAGHFAVAGPRQSPKNVIFKLVALASAVVVIGILIVFNFESLKESWQLGSRQMAATMLKPADIDSGEAALKNDVIPVSEEPLAGAVEPESEERAIVMDEQKPLDPNQPVSAPRKYKLKEIEKRSASGSEYYSRYSPKSSWKLDPIVGNRRRIDYRDFKGQWLK